MQKSCINVGLFLSFLHKYSLKIAFLAGFGEQIGEQNIILLMALYSIKKRYPPVLLGGIFLFERFIFRSVFCRRNTIEIFKHVIEMAQRVKPDSCTNIQGVVVGCQ